MTSRHNEVGTGAPRGRPILNQTDAERDLSRLAKEEIRLPENAVVTGVPSSCPACGSQRVMWGCADQQTRTKAKIHPLVWDDEAWMAESFVCRECNAGSIEPDEPEEIT